MEFFIKVSPRMTILITGHDLSTILLMSQSLGKSALASLNNARDQMKAHCLNTLVELQRVVFPGTSEDGIKMFSLDILEMTIALRDAMTIEQAIYRCFFVERGLFDPSKAQIQEGDPTDGEVFAGMFPGLVRLHSPRGRKRVGHDGPSEVIEVMVVKSFVKLNTAFQPDQRIKNLDAPHSHMNQGAMVDISEEQKMEE